MFGKSCHMLQTCQRSDFPSLLFQIHVVTDQEEQEGVYTLGQVCRMEIILLKNMTISTFLATVANVFLFVLSGVVTDAGKHCDVSRKRNGDLVPGETG